MKFFLPLVLAIVLFVLNNLAILSGWLYPPDGYAPTFMIRGADIAQYETWMQVFQDAWLIPNYHAPWQTEPAFFNPLLWLISKTSALLGSGLVSMYHLFHFALYVIAAYSLFFAVLVFTETRNQALLAFLAIFSSVPLPTLGIIPALVVNFRQLPGIGYFVWWSSDGFFHGISGSILVTFGTATTLLAFSLLAKYLKTGQKRYLAFASLVTFLSAFIHPFEVSVIVSAGSITLLMRRGKEWRRAVPDVLSFGLSGALGLFPYVFLTLRYPWLNDAARLNRWSPGSPIEVLIMLGLPTVLALVFLVTRPKMTSITDVLLQSWVILTLVGIYIPWIPYSQHLFDGYHYAIGLLLARQVARSPLVTRIWNTRRSPALAVISIWCLLTVVTYLAFYLQSFKDGRTVQPERLFSTVAPKDELAAISWMRQHATPNQLVLAPSDSAPWFATVPMHSFASHYLLSLTYQEQIQLADEFYNGRLNQNAADSLLTDYGIRYVIVPDQSPAVDYLEGYDRTIRIGSLTVYEFDSNTIKSYPVLRSRP